MKKLKIIYEDKYLIIVYKEHGLLSIASDKVSHSLYSEVRDYVKRNNKNNKIFIVHRLDRDTSGLMLFAKSESVKFYFQDNWNNVVRKYYALVHGKSKKYDKIESYLRETKTYYTYISSSGDRAITEYNTISYNNGYSLIDIRIYTGRKNQIRVQLSDNGLPIVGDKKYGIKDKSNFMLLTAYYLEFIHPMNKENMIFKIDIPDEYKKYIK